MSGVFADTSAFLSTLNASDRYHRAAQAAFELLRHRRSPLITTSYVLVETYALVGRRMGLEAVEAFRATFEPILEIVWVDAALHEAGLDLLLSPGQPRISLVDAVSFAAMRRLGLTQFFGFDSDFEREGFTSLG